MDPTEKGASPGSMELKTFHFPIPSSSFHGIKFQVTHAYDNENATRKIIIFRTDSTLTPGRKVKKFEASPQNVDLPPILPKKKKKPYPIPITKIQQAARADKKLAEMGIEKPLEPPKNGQLVPELIPVAYEVVGAWKILISGLARLLHVVPVHACSECSDIHVALAGHNIQDCCGPTSGSRKSFHSWVKGSINDVLVPIESYHMFDPFGQRIKHETRFNYDRIPSVIELCIQAGVELPDYPSRRRTRPIRMIGKKVIDIGGLIEEPELHSSYGSGSSIMELDTYRIQDRYSPPAESDVPKIAQQTIKAYEKVKRAVTKLMKKYTVKACGVAIARRLMWAPGATTRNFVGNSSISGETGNMVGKMRLQMKCFLPIMSGMLKIRKGRH